MSCEQCTQGFVIPGEPKGSMVDDAYFHPGPEGAPKRVIVLLTDIFGLPLNNCKLTADELSRRVGCVVWVPDLFAGNPPFTPEELEPIFPQRPSDKFTIYRKASMAFMALKRMSRLISSRPSIVDPRTTNFMDKIKKEKGYEKVGAIGYCFGGSLCIRLGGGKHVDSLVVCHPGMTSVEQIKSIKVPTSWVCAEEDMTFKQKLREDAEKVFAGRKDTPQFVEYEFKDYPGTIHGFAARPNMSIPEAVEGYKGALDQASSWFEKTLLA